ncbi:MAG: hypothetical protein AAGH19_10335, partial [Pseudomonadota bacterium]
WLLIGFGLAYMAWGLRRAWRHRPHSHWHAHEGALHTHPHSHTGDHVHVHDEVRVQDEVRAHDKVRAQDKVAAGDDAGGHELEGRRSIAPWIIFIIFVLGPCEPLIPLLMYPAATHSVPGVLLVTTIFGVVTVLTMLVAVTVAVVGLSRFKFGRLAYYDHALAGFAVLACGLAITFLGL